MIVDTSALTAVILGEPDAEAHLAAMVPLWASTTISDSTDVMQA
ncbi:MAG: type II toxin-antitoxin system VapC family toxin [Propionibacteriales bacterium]|nr:type II toxin-antitoxin system VapC family toxin [Propionibacteriales bacterium]